MKKCFFILFFIHFVLLSNAQKLTNFRFQLSFEKEKLGIIDPWDFSLEIVNTLNSIVHVYPLDITKGRGSNYGYIQLEIKNNSDLTWKSSGCILNMHKELGSPLISLNPGQSIGSTFFCPSPAKGLLEIGDVFVRSVYAPFGIGDTTRLFSNEIKIQILEYTGDDSSAYRYLNGLRNPDFFLYPIYSISGIIDTSDVKHAEFIINQFPSSSFIDYSELFSSVIYSAKALSLVKKTTDAEVVLFYLRKSKKHALVALNSRNKRISEYAAFILSSHLNSIVMPLYSYDPPREIEKEFSFKE